MGINQCRETSHSLAPDEHIRHDHILSLLHSINCRSRERKGSVVVVVVVVVTVTISQSTFQQGAYKKIKNLFILPNLFTESVYRISLQNLFTEPK